jgi:hypothetical protein
MANTDKIRAILAAELRRKLSDTPKKPFMRFANYEFEGELKRAGDSVTVPVSPKITLTDVSSANSGDIRATSIADITASDRTVTHSTLAINKLHQYREKFSDLEEIQTLYSIQGNRLNDLLNGMDTAVEQSIITMLDAFFLAHSSNVVSESTLTAANVAEKIMKLRTKLSEKEVPMENRILVVSPAVSAIIAQAGILAGTEVAADAAVEGWLGKFAGFSIFESNLISGGNLYAFRAKAYNYVRQLFKAKVTEAEARMYYNILGQIAHGGKVFDQNAEQLYKMEVSGLNPTPTETETA